MLSRIWLCHLILHTGNMWVYQSNFNVLERISSYYIPLRDLTLSVQNDEWLQRKCHPAQNIVRHLLSLGCLGRFLRGYWHLLLQRRHLDRLPRCLVLDETKNFTVPYFLFAYPLHPHPCHMPPMEKGKAHINAVYKFF